MAGSVTCRSWTTEHVPDPDLLYKRVRGTELGDDGYPKLNVFNNRGSEDPAVRPGLSTDWCKYATPAQTQAGSRQVGPSEYGVISFIVGEVRNLPMQSVEHTPICHHPAIPTEPNNRAHAEIFGPKSKKEAVALTGQEGFDERVLGVEIRAELRLMYRWETRLPEQT
jgi:hypothetical protein